MVVADMDGELVMMDVDQGSYFSVNQVGGHIWTQLETPQTVMALIKSVQQSFKSADTPAIEADVNTFLADLASNQLISEVVS
jgi:hypothetical protein